jgi:putative ABC transport system permease protein
MMSFTVAQRRREIGIRIALGAERSRVVRGVLARSLRPLLYGVAAGALAAPFLLGVDAPWNAAKAASLVAVAALMVLVGVLASIGPTRRSLRIEPVEALKDA